MNSVNKTLYIPLYGKACVSRRGLFLEDKKAEQLWEEAGFALKGKARSKWLALYMGIRSAVFDSWLKARLDDNDEAVVLHIGCGLDSRVLRVGSLGHGWYDVDFPEVMAERKRWYQERDKYRMIPCDVRDAAWLEAVPKGGRALIIMEGVSMYLSPGELYELMRRLCGHFEHISLLMDCYTMLAARLSKYRNPINEVGVSEVYGLDEPTFSEGSGLVFVREHEMTPEKYIEELRGAEKYIFKKLYAGGFSKKLYRLFEYEKM